MAKTLHAAELRDLSDVELDELAWRVEAEHRRRQQLQGPPSFVQDLRDAIARQQEDPDAPHV
jgi:hypothetical protein